MTPQQRGQQAEALAARFLEGKGLCIVARNMRCRYGEIDLVAKENGGLVFVEVRLRSSPAFGGAAASITVQKQRRLWAAAQSYLAALGEEPPCRFDAVLLSSLDMGGIDWRRDILQASR